MKGIFRNEKWINSKHATWHENHFIVCFPLVVYLHVACEFSQSPSLCAYNPILCLLWSITLSPDFIITIIIDGRIVKLIGRDYSFFENQNVHILRAVGELYTWIIVKDSNDKRTKQSKTETSLWQKGREGREYWIA